MRKNNNKCSQYGNLAVVVVHYGDREETYDTLNSLQNQDYPRLKVFIIDNDPNHKLNKLKLKKLKYNYQYFSLPKNLGWAGGANYGAKIAVKDYFDIITFMTSDLIVTESNFLSLLAEPINNKTAKVTLPVTVYKDNPELIWMASAKVNKWTLYTYDPVMNKNRSNLISYPNPDYGGKGLTFEAKLLEKINYWDTRFFLFFEDVDICLRAAKLGWRVKLVPEAYVLHNVSTYYVNRGKVQMSTLSAFYAARSSFIFAKKYLSGLQLITSFISQFVFKYPIFIVSMLIQGNLDNIISYSKGLLKGAKIFLDFNNDFQS